jgi:soluble epoxide hydrolase/lipid-phosphate phosphatase
MPRLSIPYVPPKEQHMSVEDMVKLYPSYGYQMYFASESSTSEIEENVCIFFFHFMPLTQVVEARPLSWYGIQNA